MKNHLFISLAVASSALLLSACGGKDSVNPADMPTACTVTAPDDAGGGRNVKLRCNGQQVLNSAEMQKYIDPSVRVSFGKGGDVIKADLQTRQAANATGRNDDVACQRAFINAVVKFQQTAKKLGGSGVANFHSYLDRNVLSNGQYDCEAGTWHARVLMRGDVGR